ncbi:MAG: AmmeMemoRadiSam system radical SAM enzyme [Oscillospiraceae bacterium]|nr:AmmeMemoRadiSam system radical SAM enzyme [Oscillospiraceae bacterium]
MSETREAAFWESANNRDVLCGLCPHRCHIATNKAGICGARANKGGRLVALGYGQVSSLALDPIEKKPLYMFHPGKKILSVGGFGCNLKCPFCQNFEISTRTPWDNAITRDVAAKQTARRHPNVTPDEIATIATHYVSDGNIGLAYTYNEPLIGFEFLFDCATAVRDAGLENVIVTNGYINRAPLENLLPLIGAMNIDLKGFTNSFYEKLGGKLEPVMETIAVSSKQCHIEVTTLVIPEENEDDIEEIAKWLSSIDPEIPLHISRFFPRYLYSDKKPTPRATMYKLADIAKRYLSNVFLGNI